MRKIKSLARYQIIDLKRGALIWVIAILYSIGVQQAISSMSNGLLTLAGYIKVSWLPLNFIMIPVILVGISIGSKNNDIFDTMDISPSKNMVGKFLTLAIFCGIILIVNILIFVGIAVITKVSLGYFLYQFIGYFINTFIFLIGCSSIGLFLGQVICKYLGEVLSFIVAIILFSMLCNFYKVGNVIFPLINLRTISSIFDVIVYDRSYFYHNLFWLIFSISIITIPFALKDRRKESRKVLLVKLSVYFSLFVICICLICSMILLRPRLYEIETLDKHQTGNGSNNTTTYFGDKSCGYYINKYTMDLNIGNKLKNNCQMEIAVDGYSIKTVELGLYEKLNISNIEVNDEKLSFSRTDNSFEVILPREYKKGEIINLKIQYEGLINTVWLQGREFFYARNNSIFLADVFEWYPKLNDNRLKEYNLDIKYDGTNSIYSNLNIENKAGEYKLTGQDNEIFLVSNKMVERTYKNYLLIGNEEHIKSDKKCDGIINTIANNNTEDRNRIVLAIPLPGKSNVGGDYKNTALFPLN